MLKQLQMLRKLQTNGRRRNEIHATFWMQLITRMTMGIIQQIMTIFDNGVPCQSLLKDLQVIDDATAIGWPLIAFGPQCKRRITFKWFVPVAAIDRNKSGNIANDFTTFYSPAGLHFVSLSFKDKT